MLLLQYCKLEKYSYFNTTNIFTFWRFGLYQRPSSEEVYSILLPVLATTVMRRGKKSVQVNVIAGYCNTFSVLQ